MSDYNPNHDINLNARDELASNAPILNCIFDLQTAARLAGLKDGEEFVLLEHLPLVVARWRYKYADAMLKVRKENQ